MTLSAVYIVRASATVFQALGLFLTVWRIYIRLRIQRFWWEDAWAVVLLFTGVLWLIAEWAFLFTDGLTSIVNSWIYSMGFTCIVTVVRMSILFSIIRISQGEPRLLKVTYACVVFYVVVWTVLIAQKVAQCAFDPSWHHRKVLSGKPFCLVSAEISIFEFTTDCVAVSIIVVIPLRMLWRVKLPKRQRRMILCLFASSVLLAFGALFHMIGQILNIFLVMIAGINVEVTLAFLVCNLLVVVTYTYRHLLPDAEEKDESTTTGGHSSSDDDDFTTRRCELDQTPLDQTPPSHLTTIELDNISSALLTTRCRSENV
ncbi:hypothetical protein JVU11DRAFT_7126 [Chiua virens]|nr:hypothetical protein JVU11DRAFT_7126 [Chiua virens]